MDKLTPTTRGFWSVETVSGSIYLLDLDNGACHAKQRSPREMATHCDGMATRSSCYACSGVKSETAWSSFLDLNVPGVDFTTRISTTVIRIERIRVPLDRGI